MYGGGRTERLVLNCRAWLVRGFSSPACIVQLPSGWELSMSQLSAYRVALRAAQFAIAAAGILFLLLLFSRQAHAATGDNSPPAPSAVTPGSPDPSRAGTAAVYQA